MTVSELIRQLRQLVLEHPDASEWTVEGRSMIGRRAPAVVEPYPADCTIIIRS